LMIFAIIAHSSIFWSMYASSLIFGSLTHYCHVNDPYHFSGKMVIFHSFV